VSAARRLDALLGAVPFVAVLAAWWAFPLLVDYPAYMLPSLPRLVDTVGDAVADGSLAEHVAVSLARLGLGFLVGNGVAIPLGIAIALNRHVADLLKPLLTFLQSIAGIAWVPLAIIWFGIGQGAVVFVIANTIFFASIYNTVVGVQQIPNALHRAVRCLGGRGLGVFTELILPGALTQIIVGLRTSMAYGWRALVAAEMIAGTSGLGYISMEAVQLYRTDTIIMGMIVIGVLWLLLDRLVFAPLERATVVRWGLVQR
jgi:NitT/TauT family transport system permease protein/taurine transport system permease protein